MEIDGSVALVTGANRGLGQAYARSLSAGVRRMSTAARVIRPRSPSQA
jgi:NAD(P)-dependent dehydrogenase (short-subunit alcohol dehydrogenase family)